MCFRKIFEKQCWFNVRAVQKLDALVGRMVEGDLKQVWVEQLSELRRDLTAATETQIELSNMKAATESRTRPSGNNAPMPETRHTAHKFDAHTGLAFWVD